MVRKTVRGDRKGFALSIACFIVAIISKVFEGYELVTDILGLVIDADI